MDKQKIKEAIYETQQCLIRYWQKDNAYAVKKLTQDILWIGALADEYMQGVEAVKADLEETNRTNPLCHLLRQEFWCSLSDVNTCVVNGRYFVTTDNETGQIIQEQHRITFIWRLVDKELKIAQMHISQPIGYLEEGEKFPHKIGKMSYEYLQSLSEKYQKNYKSIQVKDLSGHIRFLSEAEIEFAEAKGHNTLIGGLNAILESRIEWKDFLKELGRDFVRVHRSFVVNRRYIKILRTKEIEMQSGVKIPIPVKKRKEIYKNISSVV